MKDQNTQQSFYADVKKMKLGEKIYTDKVGFKFKLADLTIDEEDEVNKLLKFDDDGSLTASNDDTKRLLSIVLEDVNGDRSTLNPGRLTPATAVQVLHDFLLRQKEKEYDLQNYILNSTNDLKKYTNNTKSSEDSNQSSTTQ
ncbi:hypothetical protein IT417_03655 [bacterium]|nr:hypothetical protein [bacterium]